MEYNKYVITFHFKNQAKQGYLNTTDGFYDVDEEIKNIQEKMCEPIAYFSFYEDGTKNGMVGIFTDEVITYDVTFSNTNKKKKDNIVSDELLDGKKSFGLFKWILNRLKD